MIVPMQLKSLLAVARKIYCAECVRVGVFFVLPGRGHLCPWIMNLVCTLGCRRENERESEGRVGKFCGSGEQVVCV